MPVVAPAGTVVEMADADELTLNDATAVPLNVTLVAPVRFVPRIVTGVPALPDDWSVVTKGASPVESLNTLPDLFVPPVPDVVP